jgi:hypothetical protein
MLTIPCEKGVAAEAGSTPNNRAIPKPHNMRRNTTSPDMCFPRDESLSENQTLSS